MPTFRCFSCVKDFEATPAKGKAVECPECGASGDLYVSPVFPVHYDQPTKIRGRGRNVAACNPTIKVGVPGHVFTSEPDQVTCEACKATPAYKNPAEPWFVEPKLQKRPEK
jgi:hypothetical protein